MSSAGARTLDERLGRLFASDPAAIADPFPLYRALREHSRAYEFDGALILSRYEDVRAVLLDQARFSNAFLSRGDRARAVKAQLDADQRDAYEEVVRYLGLRMVSCDGEMHGRLRRIAHRAFTPRVIATLRPTIERYVDELVDELATEERGDLAQLADRLPLRVIVELLGIPDEDLDAIHDWTGRIARYRGDVDGEAVVAAAAAVSDFWGWVEEFYERVQRDPGEHIFVPSLLDAEADERLTHEELAAMIGLVLFGGHETTTNLIATGMLELLRRPAQWRMLCENPALAPGAVEELLRFVTPAQWMRRVALEDAELAGTEASADQLVIALLAAANRDPAVFAEPEEVDITRANARAHLTFSHGPHFCLGATLARLEGTLALSALARRFPAMALIDEAPAWKGHALQRRLVSLPVELGRAAPH